MRVLISEDDCDCEERLVEILSSVEGHDRKVVDWNGEHKSEENGSWTGGTETHCVRVRDASSGDRSRSRGRL